MLDSFAIGKFFDIFPEIDLGKLWSRLRVNHPMRPADPAKTGVAPVAWIYRSERARFPCGLIYPTQDGQRLIYSPAEEDGSRLVIEKAGYLKSALSFYADEAKKDRPLLINLGELESPVASDDKKWVLRSYHGHQKADALLASISLG